MTNALRAGLDAGEVVLGTFVFEFATRGLAPLAAHAGAEFLVLDTEHTGWGWETVAGLVAATRGTAAAAVVRVPDDAPSGISRALDLGAHGVMVPAVASAAQAAAIVAAAKHPPLGRRGVVLGLAQDDYCTPTEPDALAARNRDTVVIVQVETVEGLEDVEAIAATDGIDVLWLGQLDLTASLGIPGRFDDPRYLAAVDRIAAAAGAAGKAAGFADLAGDQVAMMAARGYRAFTVGTDAALYRTALAAALARARTDLAPEGPR